MDLLAPTEWQPSFEEMASKMNNAFLSLKVSDAASPREASSETMQSETAMDSTRSTQSTAPVHPPRLLLPLPSAAPRAVPEGNPKEFPFNYLPGPVVVEICSILVESKLNKPEELPMRIQCAELEPLSETSPSVWGTIMRFLPPGTVGTATVECMRGLSLGHGGYARSRAGSSAGTSYSAPPPGPLGSSVASGAAAHAAHAAQGGFDMDHEDWVWVQIDLLGRRAYYIESCLPHLLRRPRSSGSGSGTSTDDEDEVLGVGGGGGDEEVLALEEEEEERARRRVAAAGAGAATHRSAGGMTVGLVDVDFRPVLDFRGQMRGPFVIELLQEARDLDTLLDSCVGRRLRRCQWDCGTYLDFGTRPFLKPFSVRCLDIEGGNTKLFALLAESPEEIDFDGQRLDDRITAAFLSAFASMRGIQTLDITAGDGSDIWGTNWMARLAPLTCLTRLSLSWPGATWLIESHHGVADFDGLELLASLRSLSFTATGTDEDDMDEANGGEVPARAILSAASKAGLSSLSSLTELDVHDCVIHHAPLADLIRRLPALQSITVQPTIADSQRETSAGAREFLRLGAALALTPSCASLETLVLDLPWEAARRFLSGRQGIFFPRLKSIELVLDLLRDPDASSQSSESESSDSEDGSGSGAGSASGSGARNTGISSAEQEQEHGLGSEEEDEAEDEVPGPCVLDLATSFPALQHVDLDLSDLTERIDLAELRLPAAGQSVRLRSSAFHRLGGDRPLRMGAPQGGLPQGLKLLEVVWSLDKRLRKRIREEGADGHLGCDCRNQMRRWFDSGFGGAARAAPRVARCPKALRYVTLSGVAFEEDVRAVHEAQSRREAPGLRYLSWKLGGFAVGYGGESSEANPGGGGQARGGHSRVLLVPGAKQ